MGSHYEVPSWAGKAPSGLHLDVLKSEKLTQKLMIDEKKCYLFGRNPHLNDFCIDHASCSRVHAALVYHRHLERAFLVDLGSTHGTFIGNMRLDSRKPTQLPVDSTFHFGASTRIYTLRERPQTSNKPVMDELEQQLTGGDNDGALLGLPVTETELDNLTEFNTAHNRRITVIGLAPSDDGYGGSGGAAVTANGISRRNSGVKRRTVSFGAVDEVINPEDIDPSVGRFRNLVSTTVVSAKRPRSADAAFPSAAAGGMDVQQLRVLNPAAATAGMSSLYAGIPPTVSPTSSAASTAPPPAHHSPGVAGAGLGAKLMLGINPAPEVEERVAAAAAAELPAAADVEIDRETLEATAAALEPRKKKYAKEMWPGKKTAPSLLV